MNRERAPLTDDFGGEKYGWVHCKACVAANRPSDLLKMVLQKGQAETYCAVCGVNVNTIVAHRAPDLPLIFPEGLPLGELLPLKCPCGRKLAGGTPGPKRDR